MAISGRCPCNGWRRALDNAHWGPAGRSGRVASATPHLPQTFPDLGKDGHATSGLGSAGPESAKSMRIRPAGMM